MRNYLVSVGLSLSLVALAGCAGKSDKLGLVADEGGKTYGEAYAPARTALNAGQFDGIAAKLTVNDAGLSDEDFKERMLKDSSELAMLEKGLLSLNCGNNKRALLYFDAAELKLDETEARGVLASGVSTAGKGGITALFGSEEVMDYVLRGYEKVMLYNYKALSYMLMGDRRAYNVTRKAIDRQQQEWELFQQRQDDLRKREQQRTGSEADLAAKVASSKELDIRDAATRKSASLVPNAYVNPFGDYMDAVIQEIDSAADDSLRSNARISYEKVLKNNADCTVARTAARALGKAPLPKNKKLVHIILADGFAPEFKERAVQLRIDALQAVVNCADATPVPSGIAAARVTCAGTRQQLAPLTRMESLILRADQDNAPFKTAMFTTALLRSAAAHQFGGGLLGGLAGKMQRPDTRSWLTLPNKILVARLLVPVNVREIKLETLSAQGVPVAVTTTPIAANGPTVVYGVSYERHLKCYANSGSWIQ